MYAHEVSISNGLTTMSHIRETMRPSGLVLPEIIGHTTAILKDDPMAETNLALPGMMTVLAIEANRADAPSSPADIPEKLECEDLSTFIAKGIARWKELVDRFGSISLVEITLAEERRVLENKTPSGLIVTDGSEPQTEFKCFIAQPDEIEAIETIAKTIPLAKTEASGTGLYM